MCICCNAFVISETIYVIFQYYYAVDFLYFFLLGGGGRGEKGCLSSSGGIKKTKPVIEIV